MAGGSDKQRYMEAAVDRLSPIAQETLATLCAYPGQEIDVASAPAEPPAHRRGLRRRPRSDYYPTASAIHVAALLELVDLSLVTAYRVTRGGVRKRLFHGNRGLHVNSVRATANMRARLAARALSLDVKVALRKAVES